MTPDDPPDDRHPADRVEYEPVSVVELLGEMKDIAELLVDLSYSSVLFDDPALAAEVLELESQMDVLQLRARMSLVMAGRSPDEAEELAPIFGIVGAAEKISDAAGDIAKVVLDDVGLPASLRAALPDPVETLARAKLDEGSPYADRTLGDINLETETGVRVLAVRRGGEWLLDPGRETTLRAGDVLFCRGPDDGVQGVFETMTGEPYERPAPAESDIADLDRAVETVVLMRNVSELAVDLAYGSVLFDDPELAREVSELEVEVDALKERFEAWALRAAGELAEPVTIRGLLHIATSTEVISDAALEISEGVLRGLGSHPVVQAAVEASDEILVSVPVAAGSDLAGTTIGEQALRTTTGTLVIAIRRDGAENGTDWVLTPSPETRLRADDTLIAKGTRAGAERLRALAGVEEGAGTGTRSG
ncbi:potassium channel protein [Halosimplex litoreum]|uniref:Potassium channel protein n=1 Tax=Halosimplex litoreum TaxID=1198301 RepID=A0A7T3FV61_9EURY|nr:potassium channel family protein [Halosimplex litoreum]QPV61321.1 potassium channel protein [Halosimplex litoreum]